MNQKSQVGLEQMLKLLLTTNTDNYFDFLDGKVLVTLSLLTLIIYDWLNEFFILFV